MKDCLGINKKLDMEMVKTLFLCNRNETEFYLLQQGINHSDQEILAVL